MALEIVVFSASSLSLDSGQSTQLYWETTGATTRTASGDWSGTKAATGVQTVGPLTANQTYTLTITDGVDTVEATVTVTVGPQFNCACDDETENETLADLRQRLLIRLGYAAQAANPPPGMNLLLNQFLLSAQRFSYRRYNELRTERFFKWTMSPGVRFYDLPDNDDTCDKTLDPYKVTWVGVEDLNQAWYELVEGIPPEFYTSANFTGIPSRYEIRQCIEVFVAPAAAYTLRIKGHFGLGRFTEDDDKTTIDSEVVFLYALFLAKSHYQHQDALSIQDQYRQYVGTLVAGSHGTARYIPGTGPQTPWTQPRFLPLEE